METTNDSATTRDLEAWPAAPLTRALELVAERCGVPLAPRHAWEAAAEGIGAGRGDPLRSLGLAGRRAGLVVSRPRELAPLERLSELGCPTLTWIPGGERTAGRWLVVLGLVRRRLELVILDQDGERRRWMTERELADLLERELDGAASRWVRVEPLLPLARLEARSLAGVKLTPLRRALALVRLEREDIGVVLVYAIAVGSMTLAVPVAVQALVNSVALGSVVQPLVVLSLLLALGLTFVAALQVLQTRVVESIQQRLMIRVAADFARRLPRLAAAARLKVHGPELANRVFEVVSLQKAGATLLLDGTALVLQMLVGMALLGFYHPILLAFDLVLVVGVLLVVFVAGRGAVTSATVESSQKYAIAAWVQDLAGAPLRFSDARSRAFADARAEVLIREWLNARQDHFKRILRQLRGGLALQVLASTSLLGLGGWLVIQRQLTLGQLVAAELVVAAIGLGLGKLSKQLESVYDAAASAAKLGKVVDMPIELGGGELLDGEGPLEVVVRRRSDGATTLALAPGEKLALVGRTPAHSAMCDLLFGLREDPELDVRIEGCALRGLDLEILRGEVALLRGVQLVGGSVRDNLDPRPIPSDGAAIREVLERVGLADRVAELADGLATPLLANGSPLGEAEARRLMLAAALLRRPRLLLIDGGLDGLGLDPAAHGRLLDHLFASDAPWTLIVITEDPDLPRRCTQWA